MRPRVLMLVLAALLVAGLIQSLPAPASPSGLVVSELRFRGPAGANDEFVELLNASAAPLDVSGLRLQGCTSTSGAASTRATIPAGTSLAPGQHYLLAHTGYTGSVTPDQTYATGIADAGGARVIDAAGAHVDGAGSSAPATSDCREGAGLTLPTADTDASFERRGEGEQDSDDNTADFVARTSDPQSRAGGGSPPPPVAPCWAAAGARQGLAALLLAVQRSSSGLQIAGAFVSRSSGGPGFVVFDRAESLQVAGDGLVVRGVGLAHGVAVSFTATLRRSGSLELEIGGRPVFSGEGKVVSDCAPG